MLINAITDEEYQMLDSYRRDFMYYSSSAVATTEPIAIRGILCEWAEHKQTLYKMFGNQLIVSKQCEIKKPIEQIKKEIEILKEKSNFISNLYRQIYEHYPMYSGNGYYEHTRLCLFELISSNTLATNIYSGTTQEIIVDENHFTLRNGCKAMRALRKVAEIFKVSGFEEFRIQHSQILNEVDIKGKVCLSIHP